MYHYTKAVDRRVAATEPWNYALRMLHDGGGDGGSGGSSSVGSGSSGGGGLSLLSSRRGCTKLNSVYP
jgi:hypothetical protein